MAPLAERLVGYLSMFLQLGVLALVTALAGLVRLSLGRRVADGWTAGLALYTGALVVLGIGALRADVTLSAPHTLVTIGYALLEDLAFLCFIAALRRERGVQPVPPPLAALVALFVGEVAVWTLHAHGFFAVYQLHAGLLSILAAFAAFEALRARTAGFGSRLLAVAFIALTVDYAHAPLLTLCGVHLAPQYLGLESYVTMVLDVMLGIAIVVHATDATRAELEERNAELAEAEAALRAAAFTDALCDIPNRAAFVERLAASPVRGVVAMVDLDGLKTINDRYGHAAGDAALAMTARVLRDRCGAGATVYRIGGDEFAVLSTGRDVEDVRDALTAAEHDLVLLADDAVAPARISWGAATFGNGVSLRDALAVADDELYARRAAVRG